MAAYYATRSWANPAIYTVTVLRDEVVAFLNDRDGKWDEREFIVRPTRQPEQIVLTEEQVLDFGYDEAPCPHIFELQRLELRSGGYFVHTPIVPFY